jgi:hypothetical protein
MFRTCIRGEQIKNYSIYEECVICPNGFFSIEPMSNNCK